MGVEKVARDVWMIEERFVNAFVIAADEPVVVDTGTRGRVTDLFSAITSAGVDPPKIRHIAITHYHPDHIGGLSRLQTIATTSSACVHPLDAPVVRGEQPQPGPSVGGLQGKVASLIGRRIMGRPTPAHVDREVVDGEEVCEGLRVVHTPGHTGGHVSYLWEPDRVLFVGDAATHLRSLSGPSATFTEDDALARESISRISGLEFDVAVFGHGKPLAGDAAAAFRELAQRQSSGA